MIRSTTPSTLFPYTTLFRSSARKNSWASLLGAPKRVQRNDHVSKQRDTVCERKAVYLLRRSEEHTSELQSHVNLVCRLLLEKKNQQLTRKLSLRSTRSSPNV